MTLVAPWDSQSNPADGTALGSPSGFAAPTTASGTSRTWRTATASQANTGVAFVTGGGTDALRTNAFTGNATVSFRGIFTTPSSNPSGTASILVPRTPSGVGFRFQWLASGAFQVLDTGSTARIIAAAGVLALATRYGVQAWFSSGTSTTGVLHVQVTDLAGNVVATYDATNINLGTLAFTHFDFDPGGMATNYGWSEIAWDDSRASFIPLYAAGYPAGNAASSGSGTSAAAATFAAQAAGGSSGAGATSSGGAVAVAASAAATSEGSSTPTTAATSSAAATASGTAASVATGAAANSIGGNTSGTGASSASATFAATSDAAASGTGASVAGGLSAAVSTSAPASGSGTSSATASQSGSGAASATSSGLGSSTSSATFARAVAAAASGSGATAPTTRTGSAAAATAGGLGATTTATLYAVVLAAAASGSGVSVGFNASDDYDADFYATLRPARWSVTMGAQSARSVALGRQRWEVK
jgi:hypothetical protein